MRIRLLFLRYLNYFANFWGHVKKRLDKKAKVNIKIYDITDWETNNCYKHIAQYVSQEVKATKQ